MTIQKQKLPKIVCIGGGTGTFVVLRGLKNHPVNLTAIVTMSDSGGSNKRIRDEFGLLPTSDIRQCFVALSDENGGIGLMRKLFMYRFEKGEGIRGMTFGNLFMAALTDIVGSQKEAIKQTRKVLKIKGTVLPVSYTPTNLVAEYEDGTKVTEEHFIDEPLHDGTMRITSISLWPEAEANPDALKAIHEADLIVLGPGDLYTSLIPNLLVKKIPEAIQKSKAKKVFVVNLMTKYGQTYGFTALDHVNVVNTHVLNSIDIVIVNAGALPKEALELYEQSHEFPVINNLPKTSSYTIITADVVANTIEEKSAADVLVRSLVRHDSKKLADQIMKLVQTL
ncbi:MAG: YvcK family protein [Patescibacteria group bacterium]|nr:YvcK family protein [Patescibacteria group bacterium]